MDRINGRRVIASTVGGALIGRFVADLVGAPPWVGGVLGAAAPVARSTGAVAALPGPVASGVRILAMPGEAIGRAMYPDGLTLPAPYDDEYDDDTNDD